MQLYLVKEISGAAHKVPAEAWCKACKRVSIPQVLVHSYRNNFTWGLINCGKFWQLLARIGQVCADSVLTMVQPWYISAFSLSSKLPPSTICLVQSINSSSWKKPYTRSSQPNFKRGALGKSSILLVKGNYSHATSSNRIQPSFKL
jgi:hypothetical protein